MNRWTWSLLLALVVMLGCERPSQGTQTPPQTTEPPVETAQADGLRALDAPLETVQEEGTEPRAVEPLGPEGPTLLFTAALKGYVEPCTCTLDTLLGGIGRISGYVRTFAGLSSSAAVIDTGDLLFEGFEVAERDAPQALLKARLLLQAHTAMGTASTTPGAYDLALGLDTYRELLAETPLPITVANLSDREGQPIGDAQRVIILGELRVGLTAVVDPNLVHDHPDVVASDITPALSAALEALAAEDVDVRVAVAQGELAFAREVAAAAPSLDFVVIGHEPRQTDEVSMQGETALLEAYSQGRYVGVLRLYPNDGSEGRLVNARHGSQAELEKLDRKIAYIDEWLNKAPPALPGQEPPLVKKKREELNTLRDQRLEMSSLTVDVPEAAKAFAYFAVSLEPGYPLDVAIHERKKRYDRELETLYTELAPTVAAAAEGQASYVGGEACADCHAEAQDFWVQTPHHHAFETLEAKGKTFDPECLSCHVTGYEQPGGSIVGSVAGLEDVQCESCHGPGSLHVDEGGEGHISLEVPESLCVTCHDALNSPRFSYDRYLPLILGPGHGGE